MADFILSLYSGKSSLSLPFLSHSQYCGVVKAAPLFMFMTENADVK